MSQRVEGMIDDSLYNRFRIRVDGKQYDLRPSYGIQHHQTANETAFFRFSSLSLNCLCDSCCFKAALASLCRFRLPLPLLGPLITKFSVILFFRRVACSERVFSRFLSRFRRDVMDDLSSDP